MNLRNPYECQSIRADSRVISRRIIFKIRLWVDPQKSKLSFCANFTFDTQTQYVVDGLLLSASPVVVVEWSSLESVLFGGTEERKLYPTRIGHRFGKDAISKAIDDFKSFFDSANYNNKNHKSFSHNNTLNFISIYEEREWTRTFTACLKYRIHLNQHFGWSFIVRESYRYMRYYGSSRMFWFSFHTFARGTIRVRVLTHIFHVGKSVITSLTSETRRQISRVNNTRGVHGSLRP